MRRRATGRKPLSGVNDKLKYVCKICILGMEMTLSFDIWDMVIALLWIVFDWHWLLSSCRPGNPGCMEESRGFQFRIVSINFPAELNDY